MNMSFIAYQIKKLVAQRSHGKNYIKVKPPLAGHLLRNPLNFKDLFKWTVVQNVYKAAFTRDRIRLEPVRNGY